MERLDRGSIIGAYSFLVADENTVTATCSIGTHIFTIERKRFTQLVQRDAKLFKRLLAIQDELLVTPTNDRVLDYIKINRRVECSNGEYIYGD